MGKVNFEFDSNFQPAINGAEAFRDALVQTRGAHEKFKGDFKDSIAEARKFEGAIKQGVQATHAFEEAVSDLSDDLSKTSGGLNNNRRSAEELKAEYNRLKTVMKNSFDVKQLKDYEKEMESLKAEAKGLGVNLEEAGKKGEKSLSGLASFAKKVGLALTAAFSITAILSIGKNVLDVTSSFQKFEAVLTNTLGSKSAAKKALNDITDFAAKTPFGVEELTGSFVKLANQGFRPTIDQLRQLGDLAASQGKSFDQLTEGMLDAQTGEFERLKEFGIIASKQGDKVTFSFKGVETQVKFSNEAIRNYILSLGDLEGVSGGMEGTSKTLGGQLNNLTDSLGQLYNTLGDNVSPQLSYFIELLDTAIKKVREFIESDFQKSQREYNEEASKLLETYKGFSKLQITDTISKLKAEIDDLDASFESNQEAIAESKNNIGIWGKALSALNLSDEGKRVEALTKENEGYSKQIHVNQIAIEQLELKLKDLGKTTQTSASETKKLTDELDKLLKKLATDSEKARIAGLDPEARIKAERDASLKSLDVLESEIRELNKKLGKKAQLTKAQNNQLGILRNEANKKYIDDLNKFYADEEQARIDNSNKAKGDYIKAIDTEEAIQVEKIKRIQDGGKNEEDLERLKHNKILQIQIEFAQKKLEFLQAAGNTEDALQIEQLKTFIANAQGELEKDAKKTSSEKFSMVKLLGLEMSDQELSQKVGAVMSAYQQITTLMKQAVDEEVTANQRKLDSLNRSIDEKEKSLDREIKLNQLGFASSVETKRKEVDQLKAQRAKSEEDQARALKKQQQMQTASQAISLITSSTNIIQSMTQAFGAYGLIAAAVLIATMFGMFASAKSKASEASKLEKGGMLGGEIDGPSHAQGGIKIQTKNGLYEIEGKEWITNKRSTAKHRRILEAINMDNNNKIAEASLSYLKVGGDGIMYDMERDKDIVERSNAVVSHEIKLKSDYVHYKGVDKLNDKMDTLIKNTDRIPKEQVLPVADNTTHVMYISGGQKRTIKTPKED